MKELGNFLEKENDSQKQYATSFLLQCFLPRFTAKSNPLIENTCTSNLFLASALNSDCLNFFDRYFTSLVQIESIGRQKFKPGSNDKMIKFLINTIENILGLGENPGSQHFLLFLNCFEKASSLGYFFRVVC